MLHGAGGSASNVLSSTRWAQLADQDNFVVVCPNGTPCDEASPENFRRNPQTWNSQQGFSISSGGRSAEAKGIDDVFFLAALVSHVSSFTAINPRQVFVAGHSNGACMAFHFAASRPDIIACVGVSAGHLHPGLACLPCPVSLMCVSGDQDPFAPLNPEPTPAGLGGQRKITVRPQRLNVVEWARANGIPDTATTLRDDMHITDLRWGPNDKKVEVRWVVVKGQGHSWPGGVSRLPVMLVGPKSNAFDCTLEMWMFFKAHPKA
jgi:polyhydroxybutyrate depolymerase